MIWSRWVAISSLPPICGPSFSFMGRVRKKKRTKLKCEKCRILSTAGAALSCFQFTSGNLTDWLLFVMSVTVWCFFWVTLGRLWLLGPESFWVLDILVFTWIGKLVWVQSSLWAHLLAAYLFTGWTCLMLYLEYGKVENMRYKFIAAQKQRPDQFTVIPLPSFHTCHNVGFQFFCAWG